MTLVCPAHISSCGQLFRPVGAHQHSVANGGVVHQDIYTKTSKDADVGHTKEYYKSDKQVISLIRIRTT
jgi:hypothetical protein